MKDKFSIIIQGPLHANSLNNIENYKKFGEVIISCWAKNELSYDIETLIDCTIVKTKNKYTNYANPQNIFLQSLSTLAGLKQVETQYFIKVRSDESYSDLSPIVEMVYKEPNKYICNNIWFKKIEKEWLHPSDHLIAGSTEKFKETFNDVLSICKKVGPVNNVLSSIQYGFSNNIRPFLSVETVIFLSFLKTIYRNNLEFVLTHLDSNDRLKELMIEHCNFVPIDSLGNYTWSHVNTRSEREYHSTSETLYNWPDSPSIKSLDEL